MKANRKSTYCEIPFIENSRKCKLIYKGQRGELRTRKVRSVGRELEGRITKGHEESFEGNGYIQYLEWLVSYVKTYHIVQFIKYQLCTVHRISIIPHRVQFVNYQLYLIETIYITIR